MLSILQLASMAVIAAAPAPRPAAGTSCAFFEDAATPYLEGRLATLGTTPAQMAVPLGPGHEWLVEVREQGNDAIVEIRDGGGRLLAQADHPERRTGTRRVIVSPSEAQSLTLLVTGKEHDAVSGMAEIVVFDLAALSTSPMCIGAFRSMAAADADYAIGQQISLGRASNPTQTARAAYLKAADEYQAAERLLDTPGDASLRGEAALALAGVRYFDLQDWRGSAEWAETAMRLFGARDPYRHAWAQALAAAAWIEMATESATRPGGAGGGAGSKELLAKARRSLDQLYSFHSQRREWYDAALQTNNIGLAYMYEGRFRDCVTAARAASRMFARLRETPRQGLAWQNRALCYWGLGHLPQALDAFNQALEELKPEPYPQLYLLTLSNTALINYALGHFDDSLRLHDRSLELATRIQNQREQAQSLYGIGVTYYALGDPPQAREFLERSLAIRSTALDGRGRRATLRSLATVYADLGEYDKAIEFDREALALATAPNSRARSRIQLAVHTALNGNAAEGLEILGELLAPGTVTDPLIRAQARLQRAAIERRGGAYDAALRDLATAIPVFRRIGSVTDGFSADLERARALRLAGDKSAALLAVEAALGRSEAIRRQTANPEFRAQLQLPLRAAYDLKLDLLWEKFDAAAQAGKQDMAARLAGMAFRSADAARARSFADIAAQQYSASVRHDLARELARREVLYRNLAALRFALDTRLDRAGSADSRAKTLESEIAGLQREVDTLNSAIAARTASRGGTMGDATFVAAGTAMALPADAAIIAYWLGTESAYCWAVTAAGIHWMRLTDPAAIRESARAFHDSLKGLADVPRERRLDTSSVLYGQVIRPSEEWVAPYRRWFFIPDGALDYVPFAALGDARAGSPYLITAHDVALAPAAWMLLAPARRPGPPAARDRLLLVSDPVYERSDPRLNLTQAPDTQSRRNAVVTPAALDPHGTYRRIPGTAREASGIQAQFPAAEVDALEGLQATRKRLLQLDWSRYRFIHIASHGHLDAQMPQLSAVILSGYDEHGERIENALRTADLSALTLTAEVAVFSGCDTALGKDVLNEGLVGIAYATLARGAGAVVSSLWQVQDEISEHLMTEFYRHLVRDSMSPVAALGASMRSVLGRNPAADPALWAAFQVSVVTMARPGSP
jgi:CHAT domain-containing protein